MDRDRLYLLHIQECLTKIDVYIGKKSREEFLSDPLLQDAILRNLQVMTESTQRLSDSLKLENPEVGWHLLAGFRNIVVHGYLSLDMALVWNILENDLPEIRSFIKDNLTG
jgi:uncharacterized protein with HEPN domain